MIDHRCIELIAVTENELKEANTIALAGCGVIYVVPELIQMAGVARSLSNARYEICAMIDYPKGECEGVAKFRGVQTDFFLTDSYDIVLTANLNPSKIAHEISSIYSFIQTMINPHAKICFTINASMRTSESIEMCAKAFMKHPPSKIKLEASPTTQPTKANVGVHKKTMKLIRQHYVSPIVISGNISYKAYKQFAIINKIAVSPQQYYKLIEDDQKASQCTDLDQDQDLDQDIKVDD